MTHPLETLFQKVIDINTLVGNVPNPSRATLMHQLQIIGSEVEELQKGFADQDVQEMRDGIADVLFTIAGLYGRMRLAVPVRWETDPMPSFTYETERRSYAAQFAILIDRGQTTMETLATLSFESIYLAVEAVARQITEYALQLAQIYGYDAYADLQAVIDSNWSKFDRTEADALLTRQKYSDIGVVVTQKDRFVSESEPPYIVTYSAMDQVGKDGKTYPKGKWLKSIHFQDTNFAPAGPSADVPAAIVRSASAIEEAAQGTPSEA